MTAINKVLLVVNSCIKGHDLFDNIFVLWQSLCRVIMSNVLKARLHLHVGQNQ